MGTRKPARKNLRDQVPALPHLDDRGFARMVDVGMKPATHRVAVAEAFVRMKPETLERLRDGSLHKGDALSVARIAGVAASKKTSDLIPLAHPISLTHVAVEVTLESDRGLVRIETRAETMGATGVEMEALVSASTAALAIYDMAKAYERGMVIERVQLIMKSGGRSGTFRRQERRGDTEPDEAAQARRKKARLSSKKMTAKKAAKKAADAAAKKTTKTTKTTKKKTTKTTKTPT